jgi:Carbohydrate binding domain/Cellulase (glycosyl hydrolase family 5)
MRSLAFLPFFAVMAVAVEPITPNTPGWFPFPISVLESAPTAIDLSYLNDKPAGARGFVRPQGEHLIDAAGKELRLYGTNFCGASCFPEPAEAEKVAAHLAKNGINVVRLHHMDNGWNQSLIADTATTKLDEANLAKLDKLAAELLKQGIYLNINLHCSRTYAGTPKDAPNYSKGLDHFHPAFISAFKSYARQLLSHVNPHTGRAYKDEPGVAVVEMKNENSLVLNPWWMTELKEPFAGELSALFVAHLRAKYATTDELRAVWGLNDGLTGPDLISNGDFAEGTKGWGSEAMHGAEATLRKSDAGGITWTSTQSGKEGFSLQLSKAGLAFDEAKVYRLSFRARSTQSAKIQVHAQNSAPPWAQLGMSQKLQLTPDWQSHEIEFAPHSVLPDGQNRIVFSLLNAVTSIDIDAVKLVSISTGYLRPGQGLETGHIAIPGRNARSAVRRDFIEFLAQLEIDHALEMKRYLREEIGVKSMITHSALLFGGIAGARREFIVSDLVDTHGYWHHPHFPNKSWDMGDWEIENVSQLTAKDGGTLTEIAMQRPFGKPYSVSEYDTPAPNDFAAETFPLLAAMACVQDWSAVYHFNFRNGGQYDSDHITSFFDLPGHPGKQAFVPLAALVYRTRLIAPFANKVARVIGKQGIIDYTGHKSGDIWGSWRDAWGVDKQEPPRWSARVGYDIVEDSKAVVMDEELTKAVGTAITNTEWNREQAFFTAARPQAIIACGRLGGRVLSQDGLSIHFDPATQNATLMLCPTDGKSIAESKSLWLCALDRAENPGMVWDQHRRTVGRKWGQGPALVHGVRASLKLPGKPWTIQALDPTGRSQPPLATGVNEFTIDPSQRTAWWLLTR